MRNFSLITLGLVWTVALSGSPNPVGEQAFYRVDKNPIRTSSIIMSGTIDASITQPLPEMTPPAYELSLDYRFQVKLFGDQQGIENIAVTENYFESEFLENLRQTGHYESPHFKVDHLGYADAINLDGKAYPHCDVLRFYDISQGGGLSWVARSLLGGNMRDDIENLVVKAHVYEEIPVL